MRAIAITRKCLVRTAAWIAVIGIPFTTGCGGLSLGDVSNADIDVLNWEGFPERADQVIVSVRQRDCDDDCPKLSGDIEATVNGVAIQGGGPPSWRGDVRPSPDGHAVVTLEDGSTFVEFDAATLLVARPATLLEPMDAVIRPGADLVFAFGHTQGDIAIAARVDIRLHDEGPWEMVACCQQVSISQDRVSAIAPLVLAATTATPQLSVDVSYQIPFTSEGWARSQTHAEVQVHTVFDITVAP